MSTAPPDGPPVWVTACVPDMRLLRALSSFLSTIAGRKVECTVHEHVQESEKTGRKKLVVWRAAGVKVPYREIAVSGRDAEAGDDLVEDEQRARRRRAVAQQLEEAVLGGDEPHVRGVGLGQDRGGRGEDVVRRAGRDDHPVELGGVQPGLYRVDAGPRVSLAVRNNMRVHLDWRQRVAGNARRAYGLEVTRR